MSKFSTCTCGHSSVKHTFSYKLVFGESRSVSPCRVKNCKCSYFRKDKTGDNQIQALKKQRFIDWVCEGCYYYSMNNCSAYKLGRKDYDPVNKLFKRNCEAWEPA